MVKYGSDIPRDERVDLDLEDCEGAPLTGKESCTDSGPDSGAAVKRVGSLDCDDDEFNLCSLIIVEEHSTPSEGTTLLSFGLGSGKYILPPAPDVRDSAFSSAFARVSCTFFVASVGSAAP